jgi:hypothetical protein
MGVMADWDNKAWTWRTLGGCSLTVTTNVELTETKIMTMRSVNFESSKPWSTRVSIILRSVVQ